MDKKEIVAILMRRDGITENEAWNIIKECQEEIDDVLNHAPPNYPAYDAITDILANFLSLEPDYIMAFI